MIKWLELPQLKLCIPDPPLVPLGWGGASKTGVNSTEFGWPVRSRSVEQDSSEPIPPQIGSDAGEAGWESPSQKFNHVSLLSMPRPTKRSPLPDRVLD